LIGSLIHGVFIASVFDDIKIKLLRENHFVDLHKDAKPRRLSLYLLEILKININSYFKLFSGFAPLSEP
jgi:hypothetical protein